VSVLCVERYMILAVCGVCENSQEFIGDSRAHAVKIARAEGWLVTMDRRALCAAHNQKAPSYSGQCTARAGHRGRCPNAATLLCESVRVMGRGRPNSRVWLARCEHHRMGSADRVRSMPASPTQTEAQ
jgi:hypothetical protein